jgi:hypothetical protein
VLGTVRLWALAALACRQAVLALHYAKIYWSPIFSLQQGPPPAPCCLQMQQISRHAEPVSGFPCSCSFSDSRQKRLTLFSERSIESLVFSLFDAIDFHLGGFAACKSLLHSGPVFSFAGGLPRLLSLRNLFRFSAPHSTVP